MHSYRYVMLAGKTVQWCDTRSAHIDLWPLPKPFHLPNATTHPICFTLTHLAGLILLPWTLVCLFVTTMVISCLWTVDTVLFPFDLRPRHACVKNYISKHCKLPYMKNAQKYAVICSEYFSSLQIMDQPKKTDRPGDDGTSQREEKALTHGGWRKQQISKHTLRIANEHLVTICGEKSRAQAPLCGFGWRRISLTHSTTCLISSRFSPHAF